MRRSLLTAAAFLFALMLVLFAHFGARLTAVSPTFSFAAEKEIYLTFDDGPSTVVTNRILDTLKEEHVKGTFFIVGDRVHGREETLARIAREGHTLGVHSKSHRYGEIYSSAAAFERDVRACAEIIEKTAGVTPKVYRFPGGGEHAAESEIVKRLGYRIVRWNAVCGDEEIKGADAKTLFETAVSTSRGKGSVVLLLHDSAPHLATAEALPDIIAYFREQGYVFKQY